MIDNIYQSLQNYYDEIPSNTAYCVGRSALFTFTVSVIFSGPTNQSLIELPSSTFQKPLQLAAYAALASFIHAIATPLFHIIFPDRDQNHFLREGLKSIVDLSLARIILLPTGWAQNEELSFGIVCSNLFTSVTHIFDLAFAAIDPIFANDVAYYQNYLGLTTPPDTSATYLIV